MDLKTFSSLLVDRLRDAWMEVRRQRPHETFYVFGIETDSDITDLNPLCNTEEEYAAQGGTSELRVSRWIGSPNEDSRLYRAGSEYTDELASQLNEFVFEELDRSNPRLARRRKKQLLRIFERALVDLDKRDFFGSGKTRHGVLLKIEFVDPDDAEWRQMLKVIRRINPRQSRAEFFRAIKAEMKEALKVRGEKSNSSPRRSISQGAESGFRCV